MKQEKKARNKQYIMEEIQKQFSEKFRKWLWRNSFVNCRIQLQQVKKLVDSQEFFREASMQKKNNSLFSHKFHGSSSKKNRTYMKVFYIIIWHIFEGNVKRKFSKIFRFHWKNSLLKKFEAWSLEFRPIVYF